ncbi:hypothetical protein RI367_003135 [Sorochytrium milnesiophthora]
MSNKSLLRIQRELLDIQRNPDVQLYVHFEDGDLTKVQRPPGTPYAFGMFEFEFVFPSNYPTTPPKVTALTNNNKNTRFNPNIYASGKVCLSILGTWTGEPGEQWSSAHGVLSVLVSIQSLMCEKPYHNEPGFEGSTKRGTAQEVEQYNHKIQHETLRISVCQRLEAYLGRTQAYPVPKSSVPTAKGPASPFDDTCKRLFMCYYERYMELVEAASGQVSDKGSFAHMPFENASNGMHGSFVYSDLRTRLQSIHKALSSEVDIWTAASKKHIEDEILTASNLKAQYEQISHANEFDGQLELELQDNNPFTWTFTAFGRPLTNYDGGLFRGQLIFHQHFPEVQPIVRFTTPVYHPNVSEGGYPFLRVLKPEDVRQFLSALVALLTDEPNPHPATHLNMQAAKQYFGDKDTRKEFNRQARRCASRSVEY